MKVEVDVPNSPYGLCGRNATLKRHGVQELCESRVGRPGLPVPNKSYGLYGRKAIIIEQTRTDQTLKCGEKLKIMKIVPNCIYNIVYYIIITAMLLNLALCNMTEPMYGWRSRAKFSKVSSEPFHCEHGADFP